MTTKPDDRVPLLLEIAGTVTPFSAAILVEDTPPHNAYVTLTQGNDEICVSERQLQQMLLAITHVAKRMKWKEYL